MLSLDEIMSKIDLSPNCINAVDFNVYSISRERLLKYFASKDFYSGISGLSTNYNSQIDYAFYRGVRPTVHFYESYFSDHRTILIDSSFSEKNFLGNCLDKIVSSSNDDINNRSICIHEIDQDVIIDQVNHPTPVPDITAENKIHKFTNKMLRALADSINLQHLQVN